MFNASFRGHAKNRENPSSLKFKADYDEIGENHVIWMNVWQQTQSMHKEQACSVPIPCSRLFIWISSFQGFIEDSWKLCLKDQYPLIKPDCLYYHRHGTAILLFLCCELSFSYYTVFGGRKNAVAGNNLSRLWISMLRKSISNFHL